MPILRDYLRESGVQLVLAGSQAETGEGSGIPVGAGLVLLWAEKALGFAVNAPWFISNVIKRLLVGVVPGSWLGFTPRMQELAEDHVTHGIAATIFNESWASLAQPGVWLGVVAGIAMLATAVRMRRRREEN